MTNTTPRLKFKRGWNAAGIGRAMGALLVATAIWTTPFGAPQAFAAGTSLSTLRPHHSRLIIDRAELQSLAERAASDPVLARAIDLLQADAAAILAEPFPKDVDYGHRMLVDIARRHVSRIRVLALAYRLRPDARVLDKAKALMIATAGLRDWNHDIKFLATSEITISMALGYDWLYGELNAGERTTIRNAIIRKGLEPGLEYYRGRGQGAIRDWPDKESNWNLVCNAGMVFGALAVAADAPGVADAVLKQAIRSLPVGLRGYAPDGAWAGGPGYWNYGTRHAALAIAALQSALGKDYGLAGAQGLHRSGYFHIHTVGPTGRRYNFGDAHEGAPSSHALAWIARQYRDPLLAAMHRKRFDRALDKATSGRRRWRGVNDPVFNIVWLAPAHTSADLGRLPLDAFFRGTAEVVTMRGVWDGDAASYAGVVAGRSDREHGHRDLGSFVYDAAGVRWAVEAGYGMGESWYHNTLSPAGRSQWHKGSSHVLGLHSTARRAHTVVDLSGAFGRRSRISAHRGIALIERRALLVQDEIANLGARQRLRWTMLTRADVSATGRRATLTQRGRTLSAEILTPNWARFEATKAKDSGERRVPRRIRDHTLLSIGIDGEQATNTVLAVLLQPAGEGVPQTQKPAVRPLAAWEGISAARSRGTPSRRTQAPGTPGRGPQPSSRGQSELPDVCDSDRIIDRILCRERGGPRR